MLQNANFWIGRVEKYGHTGWSDNITYSYDQNIRLNLIENIILKYFNKKLDISLDYGCGSGDFTYLLSKYSNKTLGVDIADEILKIAKDKYKNDNISFDNINSNTFESKTFDLISSITVLQHILDDDALTEVLNDFNKSLSDEGVVIIIDSFGKNNNSSYLKLRNFKNFIQLVEKLNFKVLEIYDLTHPQESPTRLYELYRSSYIVRIVNRLKMHTFLSKIANKISKYDNPFILEESGTKLIILKKVMK